MYLHPTSVYTMLMGFHLLRCTLDSASMYLHPTSVYTMLMGFHLLRCTLDSGKYILALSKVHRSR